MHFPAICRPKFQKHFPLVSSMGQNFLYWGNGGESPLLPTENLLISPHLENSPPPSRLPPHQMFIPLPPPKVKNIIFSCSQCSWAIFVLISYSLDTQVMLILVLIDVQYSQKIIFSFEKGMIGQNNSLSGSHHPVKTSPTKFLIPSPARGNFPPTPYHYLENPVGSPHGDTELSKQ